MQGMTPELLTQLFESCGTSAETLQTSLGHYLGRDVTLEPGESLDWAAVAERPELQRPGLVLAFEVADQGMFFLIPDTVSLPETYDDEGDQAANQRATLAMEWSLHMFPDAISVTRTEAQAVPQLLHEVTAARPDETARAFQLLLKSADTDPDGQDVSLWLVAPLINPPFPIVNLASETEPEAFKTATHDVAKTTPQNSTTDRWLMALGKLPVDIIVELAAKKIDMGQLLELSPGSLIAFDKPCEDLLNLYVNNRLCCRGEAVKIGEKFGLKINEVGFQPQHRQAIIEH